MKQNTNNPLGSLRSIFPAALFILVTAICLTSCKDDAPEKEPEPLEIAGNYTGFWNSQTQSANFVNQPVSARITALTEESYIGEFYISGNYTSCCNSGESDGSISWQMQGDSILNFRYQDIIPGCEGVFRGSGSVSEDFNLTINITGQDCDGDHVGTITLEHK